MGEIKDLPTEVQDCPVRDVLDRIGDQWSVLVLLSLGGLQLSLSAASLAHNQRAARLLEMMGHVSAQDSARAAAQEWINRTAAWVRAEVPAGASAPLLGTVMRTVALTGP